MNGPLVQAKLRLALDECLTVLAVDEGIEQLLGLRAEDFLTSRVSLKDRIHTDDADIAGMLFSPQLEKASGSFNIRLRHADGRIRCVKGQFTRESAKEHGKASLDLFLQDAKGLYASLDEPASLTTIDPAMDIIREGLYFKNRNHVITAANLRPSGTFPKPGKTVKGRLDAPITTCCPRDLQILPTGLKRSYSPGKLRFGTFKPCLQEARARGGYSTRNMP